ncbi:hypothetical protein PMAYCL1PPCAC_25101, partial [Pristionchus mayeri]
EIALVAHDNHRDFRIVLQSQDLVSQLLKIVEGRLCGDRVYQHVHLSIPDVEVSHGGELLRSCSIEDLQHALSLVHHHLIPVAVLDGGVVLLGEFSLHELHRQR